MESEVELKLEALYKQARESGTKMKPSRRHTSSLHQIIRTKEQADRFMKLLQMAQDELNKKRN